MKIKILNKPDIEKLALMPFEDKTALISIATVGADYAELKNKPEFLLQIKFNDVENDIFFDFQGNLIPEEIRDSVAEKYHIITDEQAKEIAYFIKNVLSEAKILICQCEHGQSRSAAVGAAVMEYISDDGIEIFSSDDYFPNKVVFRKILKNLKI